MKFQRPLPDADPSFERGGNCLPSSVELMWIYSMADGRCQREATVAKLEQFRGSEGGIMVPQAFNCDTFFSGWFAEP
jgi:hypothetical protein